MLLSLYMALMARTAGGGLIAPFLDRIKLKFLSTFLLAMPFGYKLYQTCYPDDLMFVGIAILWSYLWLQTGHGTAYMMGTNPWEAQFGRKQTLSPFVDYICGKINWKLGELKYCWLFMATKGLLVFLPLGYYSLLGLVVYPLSYYIGNVVFKRNGVSEILSGIAMGLTITFAV